MLSLFPEILFLSPFSAFLIRLALAGIFANAAWRHVREADITTRGSAVLEIAVATALFVGAWTQLTAIVGLVLIGLHIAIPQLRTTARGTALLMIVLCLSLLVTGAGAFAFDLPL
ncbi:hypothetical protein HY970_03340 [Candidatus Kaiserbacteria bacterium]|nr:hypothetical protein [Candidatus Kaiserbacteria bacterium]